MGKHSLLVAALILGPLNIHAVAAPLTFSVAGEVEVIFFDDNSNTFSSNFAVGDPVTFTWTVASDATDHVLIPDQLHYYDATFSANVGGSSFSGAAQYRIFNNHATAGDGFSIVNEANNYSVPSSLSPLVANSFFVQFLGMPTETLTDFDLVTNPLSLIPLATYPVAPHGFRLDNSLDNSYGLAYFSMDSRPVPEPGTFLLLVSGLGGLVGTIRRRSRK